jgi:hypothetical protein
MAIPLVVYRGADRIVIGSAEIDDDGTISARITDPVIRNYLNEKVIRDVSLQSNQYPAFPGIPVE